MREVSPAARALARQLLLHEAGGQPEPAALAGAAERVDTRLRGRLTNLIGPTGYSTLVARAVRLAQAEVPALEGITVDAGDAGAEGGLHGVREFALASGGDPGVAAAGLTAILAHLIGLLVIFIGEDLAVRLVREAWPEIAPDPADSERQA
jgi:hypothetical protein